ncbi:MAG TPA: hypothetical protein PLJ38_05535, partial [bacterium]|nr:hypothetical protein [bacterium]
MKSIITLLLICLISAISLTYINQLTAKQRSENQNKKLQEAKKNVLSDEIKNKMASISEAIEIENVKVYKVLDAQGGKLAIIAEFSGQGFAGDIKLLAAIDNDYKV